MENKRKPLRVLWFANTPGLSANILTKDVMMTGWISSLQTVVEDIPDCDLGYVFYCEGPMAPFEYGKTRYFPVQKLGNSKRKRLMHRLAGRTEYDENVPNFLKIIKEFQPDIIHVHGTEAPFGLLLRHVIAIPVVVSIQGILTAYSKKYFAGLGMPGLIRRLLSGYPFFKTDYKIWRKRERIEQEILRKVQFIFGRTDWDRRVCLVLAPGARYFHLDEVIRPRFYGLERKVPANAVPIFFTTSSPSFYKGLETVIDTARILTGNGMEANNGMGFTWLVAGVREGDALMKLIMQSRGVSDLGALNIRLLGLLSEEELAKQFAAADVFVQVSHIENSPNSLCEAMLAGMPIIASFAGGTGSLLKDGVHGVLVQDGDPYALGGAMVEMVRYPERYRPMAVEARVTALRRHDPVTIAAEMMKVYAEIIAEHGSRGNNPGSF
jgi:glycosyltransferase involved in cell wall biosynthesis